LPAVDATNGNFLSGLPSLLEVDQRTTYKELAGFGQATYAFDSHFDVTAGIRYAKNKQTGLTLNAGLLSGPSSTVISESSDNSTTFNLSPRYKFDDNVMAYARAASGYRPGGSNAGYGTTPEYGPDKVWNYEAGIKANLPAQKLYIEAAVFDIEWKDIQLQVRDQNGLGFVDNVGAARSRGLETAITWTPMTGLSLGLTAAYTKAFLTRNIPSGSYGAAGDRLPFSPLWKGTLSADYNFTVADLSAFVGASYLYNGSSLAGFSASSSIPRVRLPAYGTVDVRTGLNFDTFRVSLYVKNANDRRGYNGANARTLQPAGETAISLIQPRTVGVTLNASF
jgi:outer membrane receptor protein involved in Fe transport